MISALSGAKHKIVSVCCLIELRHGWYQAVEHILNSWLTSIMLILLYSVHVHYAIFAQTPPFWSHMHGQT